MTQPDPAVIADPPAANPRSTIHYWKCDRPAAFHGTLGGKGAQERPGLRALLADALRAQFASEPVDLRPAGGQGNHLTFLAGIAGRACFIRVEDGPEQDDYMEVESRVLDRVRACGVPTPEVLAFDASRATVPFAWQVLECIPQPDINQWHKQGTLDAVAAARTIGGYIARWQEIRPHGFGPFRVDVLRARGTLTGWHANYPDYYHARLADHLDFLTKGGFLTPSLAAAIRSEIDRHRALLELPAPCLVHKDLAFWNVLGSAREILAVIDWDDCVGGDPLDDLSLLGCFHDGPVLRAAFAGYAAVRPLPADYAPRFWLHLLRNMLLKAVIRLGSGYFELTGGFFLLGPGGTGADLKAATEARIRLALRGLTDSLNPTDL